MKRYWLFIWEDYEAKGGMQDFVMDFDTHKEAEAYYDSIPDHIRKNWENCQILDSETKEVILYREFGILGKEFTHNINDPDRKHLWWKNNINAEPKQL